MSSCVHWQASLMQNNGLKLKKNSTPNFPKEREPASSFVRGSRTSCSTKRAAPSSRNGARQRRNFFSNNISTRAPSGPPSPSSCPESTPPLTQVRGLHQEQILRRPPQSPPQNQLNTEEPGHQVQQAHQVLLPYPRPGDQGEGLQSARGAAGRSHGAEGEDCHFLAEKSQQRTLGRSYALLRGALQV